MNVLSLFDGMSCGQIALDQLGIKVDNYFAGEIDKHAIYITQKNYPNTKQIGSVTDVKGIDLPRIDLLIGGSPCQGFSTAGNELNFEDPRSKLFFEYVRMLKECNPKHFLLENVGMKKEFRDIISKYLGVEPIEINSALVSAQNRKRLYWTNIPNIQQPKDKRLTAWEVLGLPVGARVGQPQPYPRDYKKQGLKRVERIEFRSDYKSNTLINDKRKNQIKTIDGYRKLTIKECERLQTVPDGYTQGVSNTQRYKMLGNGWTVDVIKHIFKNLK
tara:strand:+ start:43 stop:861 length:819 start_codon:yes stop_codon:yes gene_type:complete